MSVCRKHGQETSAFENGVFSGLCPDCKRGVTPANIGCGSLLLIAIICAVISGGINDELESRVSELTTALAALKETAEEQTTEIQRLREKIDKSRDEQSKD